MWEKDLQMSIPDVEWRYTPTCVGKSYIISVSTSTIQVHSHVCGKKHEDKNPFPYFVGTLPRVWEKECQFL